MSICSIWGPPQSGKTTLAVNLAYGISRTEHSVCLISPVEFSECSALFGISIPEQSSLLAALNESGNTRKCAFRVAKYLYVLAMPTETDVFGSAYLDENVRQVLVHAESSFDYVIVDCPSYTSNIISAWALNRSRQVFLNLGCSIVSPMWHNASKRAIRAVEHKIVPIDYRASQAFDYAGLHSLLGREAKVIVPYLKEASVAQNDGRFLVNAGGRAGRAYLSALNHIFEVMQS